MFRTIGSALGSAASNFPGNLIRNGFPAVRPRPAAAASRGRRRRKDDANFIVIAALVAALLVAQAGWVIAQQSQP